MRLRTRLHAALVCMSVVFVAPLVRAGDAQLDAIVLPAVTPKPWRFKGFPIVAWWGPPGTATQQDFQNYKDAGFTLHMTNADTGYDQALKYVDAVGLQSLTARAGGGFELPPRTETTFPDDPSIVGWMVTDEPNTYDLVKQAVTEMNTLMNTDATRWAFFNMLSPNLANVPGYPKTLDEIDCATRNGMPIVSYDNYVLMADGTDHTAEFYSNLKRVRERTIADHVPFWAFALSVKHNDYRRPSESDMRWNQFSNLAYGAKGLWYFTYWGPTNTTTDFLGWDSKAIVDPKTGAKTDSWNWVKAINDTVNASADVLLGLSSVDVVHTKPPPGQSAFQPGTTWIADVQGQDVLLGYFVDAAGVQYAWVVNKLHGMNQSAAAMSDHVTLTFDTTSVGNLEAVSWLDGAPGPLTLDDGGSVGLDIAGGTGVLIRAGAPVPPTSDAGPPPQDASSDDATDAAPAARASSSGCALADDANGACFSSGFAIVVASLLARRRRRS